MSEKKVILIFGKRGGGKSWLCGVIIKPMPRVVVFDTIGEYKDGFIFDNTGDLCRFWKANHRKTFRLIYRPVDVESEFARVAELVWLCGDVTFVVEEVDLYASPHQIGESFKQLLQRGRHQNITLIAITQRPFGIHRLLTSQAKEIYIFSTNEPRDRGYLRDLLGSEIEPTLDALEQYQYAKWEDGKPGVTTGKA